MIDVQITCNNEEEQLECSFHGENVSTLEAMLVIACVINELELMQLGAEKCAELLAHSMDLSTYFNRFKCEKNSVLS